MSDTCCPSDATTVDHDEEELGSFWSLRDVRLAAVAGVGLAVGLASSIVDATARRVDDV